MRIPAGLVWLSAAVALGGLWSRPAELVAVAAVAAGALLAVALASHHALACRPAVDRPVEVRRAAIRAHARRSGVPRLRDPDARGRARPRAPSSVPSAA